MTELHLYEFGSGGFYAAVSKGEAFRLYNSDIGFDEAEAYFVREVPDDELVAVSGDPASGAPLVVLRAGAGVSLSTIHFRPDYQTKLSLV